VAGRVGHDEFPLFGREEAIGDIDRDALLPLGLQAIDQEREIDVLAGRPMALAVLLQGRMIDKDASASMEQKKQEGYF